MKLVFLGSPPFAVPALERLLESSHRPDLVVTPPSRPKGRGRQVVESPIATLAREAGIAVLQPATVKDDAFLDALRAVEADVLLVVSYGELLRQSFLDLAGTVSLNVHPSLLPRHRGATPVPAAILAGDEITGVSIQKVVLELDAGDVLLSRKTRVLPGETTGELLGRLAIESGDLVVEALDQVAAGTAAFTPQDPEQITHCRKLAKEDGLIDWTRSAYEIERQVRAMNPWPLAYTNLPGGAKLAVHRVEVLPLDQSGTYTASDATDFTPGTMLTGSKNRLIVACGKGALDLIAIQAAGKKVMSAGDFVRGARLTGDVRLGTDS